MITSTHSVAEVVTSHPETVRVFQRFGIDFCCGGKQSVEQACKKKGLPLQDMLAQLGQEIERSRDSEPAAPSQDSLEEIVKFLVDKHHVFTRDELARLDPLMNKVASVHGERRAELIELKRLFGALRDDLIPHMMKEELILFPFIVASEKARIQGTEQPHACFGSVEAPISMMQFEHEQAGEILRQMREMTDDYTPPLDACASYRALYDGLAALDSDLHRHIHLENNVLFVAAQNVS